MKVLVFEWMLGGGLQVDGEPLDQSDAIWKQGLAMARGIASDFLTAGCEVLIPVDARLGEPLSSGQSIPIASAEHLPLRLRELAEEADRIFLIAPESGGRLLEVVDWLEKAAGKLLSPARKWVELCADKHRALEYLKLAGIPIPHGALWRAGIDPWPPKVPVPAIIKPNDGCGGEGLREVEVDWGEEPSSGAWRVESKVTGEPLSVVAVAGPAGRFLLHPTHQRFAEGRLGDYIGGELITDPRLVKLAHDLGEQVLAALPGMFGMFGFDLIVDRCTGHATLIEINPRLTCSYLGLRRAYRDNLAASLLALFAEGGCAAPRLAPNQLGLRWGLGD